MTAVENLLIGTPYLISEDDSSLEKFSRASARSIETRDRATRVNERIKAEANQVLEPYLVATRTDLVAESNIIEGILWEQRDVRRVISTHRELLAAPVRTLVESVRADSRVYQVLGLYRAHEIAEAWSKAERVPRAYEIRELHRLILGAIPGSGNYKLHENAIGGTVHRTASVVDTPRAMLELADWWEGDSTDPLLSATVVHAWLAHIHPFEDGNGRLARILANLELARHEYPPLTIRAESDRGEYYAALAASDEGDLLPLYDLFGRILRRQTRIMARPNYILDLIEDRLLANETQRHSMWTSTLRLFTDALTTSLAEHGAKLEVQGIPDLTSFSLLCEREPDGNGWYAKVRKSGRQSEWLLWFGYRTSEWLDLDHTHPYPSIFISRRDRSPGAPHPFTPHFDRDSLTGLLPEEMNLVPAVHSPVRFRNGFDIDDFRPDEAADRLAAALALSL